MQVVRPSLEDRDVWQTPTGKRRRGESLERSLDLEYRRRWRALVLILKARLVAVENRFSTFKEAFLGETLLPDGTTVNDHLLPQLERTYETSKMPMMLPWSGKKVPS